MPEPEANEIQQEIYNRFLEDLRKSGRTNMFAAPDYLQATFGLTKKEAKAVWVKWTETFKERHAK